MALITALEDSRLLCGVWVTHVFLGWVVEEKIEQITHIYVHNFPSGVLSASYLLLSPQIKETSSGFTPIVFSVQHFLICNGTVTTSLALPRPAIQATTDRTRNPKTWNLKCFQISYYLSTMTMLKVSDLGAFQIYRLSMLNCKVCVNIQNLKISQVWNNFGPKHFKLTILNVYVPLHGDYWSICTTCSFNRCSISICWMNSSD